MTFVTLRSKFCRRHVFCWSPIMPTKRSSIDVAINVAPFPVDESNAEYLVERIAYADLPVVRLADFDAILLLDPPREVIADNDLQQFRPPRWWLVDLSRCSGWR